MDTEPGRRERRKQATRAAILETGIRMMEERGIDAVTMEEIAVAADVAKATLYAYFPSKEALIAGWIRQQNSNGEAGMAQLMAACHTTRTRLHALFTHISGWQERHRPYLERYIPYRVSAIVRGQHDWGDRAVGSGFGHHLETVLTAGQALGDVRGDVDVRMLTRALESAYFYVIMDWLQGPEGAPLGDACVHMVDLFLDGAAAQGGR